MCSAECCGEVITSKALGIRAFAVPKRHRNVMFADNTDVAPISMILTNLAGHACDGDSFVVGTGAQAQ
jgi:hypothetical protein